MCWICFHTHLPISATPHHKRKSLNSNHIPPFPLNVEPISLRKLVHANLRRKSQPLHDSYLPSNGMPQYNITRGWERTRFAQSQLFVRSNNEKTFRNSTIARTFNVCVVRTLDASFEWVSFVQCLHWTSSSNTNTDHTDHKQHKQRKTYTCGLVSRF